MLRRSFALFLAALSVLALASCAAEKPAEVAAPTGVAVQVRTVERRDVATENRASGAVTSDEETSIYVAANAKCTAVYFEAGDTVKKGDVLCTLDLASTQASYNAARISYDSAAASYDQQKEVFERQIAVYDSQIAIKRRQAELHDQQVAVQERQIAVLERQVAMQEKAVEDTKALLAIGAAAQMEVDSAELQLESTRAQLAAAQVQRDGAGLELDGIQAEIDAAELQRASAAAQRDSTLAQLRAGMESTRANLEQLDAVMDDVDDKGNVIAPADGLLAALNAAEGSYVSAGYPVAVITGAEQMKVTVYVSEALMPKLAVGDAARVSVTSAGAEFTGSIRAIEQTPSMQTRLYAVTLGVPSDVTGLVSGMFADVTFYTETSSAAAAIPSEAILTANGEQYVFVIENGAAKRVAITTGLTGAGVTEVLTGLSAGQQVVVVGQQYLSDGDAVRVVGG